MWNGKDCNATGTLLGNWLAIVSANWGEDLSIALERCELIRVGRHRLETDNLFSEGYLVQASAEFLLLHCVSDRIDLDGYEVLLLSDVTGLDLNFRRKAFIEKALKLKAISPRKLNGVELSNMRGLLQSVERAFPFVVIERERVAAGECEIGRLKVISDESYSLRPISTEGKWSSDLQIYKLNEITRVTFGGEYENTLALVAGLQSQS